MRFRHLDYGPETAVTELGPGALDSLLERGDFATWAPLLRAVARDPWSPTAQTLLHLGQAHPMYGTSALWREWIERRRRAWREAGETLAQARARAGLTQAQVAERMGIAQSDVSRLERRSDLRLSTLLAYARAIGARLDIGLQRPDDDAPRPLVLPRAAGVGTRPPAPKNSIAAAPPSETSAPKPT